jgi:hypothetical protein
VMSTWRMSRGTSPLTSTPTRTNRGRPQLETDLGVLFVAETKAPRVSTKGDRASVELDALKGEEAADLPGCATAGALKTHQTRVTQA